MSEVTQTIDELNFKGFQYDLRKIFVWGNRFQEATVKNNSGGALTLKAGTLMGRDSSDNTIVPFDSANTGNGEDVALGVLAQDLAELADAATQDNVAFCTAGDIAGEKLILINGADSLQTVVGNRTVEDQLLSQNIRVITGEELTLPDNS